MLKLLILKLKLNIFQVPVARRLITGNMENSTTGVALNKCSWNNCGTHLAVGDNIGNTTVCMLNESLVHPGANEWTEFAHSLADLKHYSLDFETKMDTYQHHNFFLILILKKNIVDYYFFKLILFIITIVIYTDFGWLCIFF